MSDATLLRRLTVMAAPPLLVIDGQPVRHRGLTVNLRGHEPDQGLLATLRDPASVELKVTLLDGTTRRWAAPTYTATNTLIRRRSGRACFVMTGLEALA